MSNRFFHGLFCTLIDHRNDAIKCSKPTSRRRMVSLPSFEHFMALILRSMRVQCLIFTIIRKTNGICFIFCCGIVKTKSTRVALQIASSSWSVLSSTIALNQSARENSDSYCKICNGLHVCHLLTNIIQSQTVAFNDNSGLC